LARNKGTLPLTSLSTENRKAERIFSHLLQFIWFIRLLAEKAILCKVKKTNLQNLTLITADLL